MYQIEVKYEEHLVNEFLKEQGETFELIDIKLSENKYMIIYRKWER